MIYLINKKYLLRSKIRKQYQSQHQMKTNVNNYNFLHYPTKGQNKIKQTDEVNPLNSFMWICRSTLHAKAYLLVVTFRFYLYMWITSMGNQEVCWNWVNNHLTPFANMYTSEFRIHSNIN